MVLLARYGQSQVQLQLAPFVFQALVCMARPVCGRRLGVQVRHPGVELKSKLQLSLTP